MDLWPGASHPLGATWTGEGTNFALFSENAEAVELCLFDEEGNETRAFLPEVSSFVWHGFAPGVSPGQRYGFRVHGPYAPEEGHRFNPNKVLLDPYARAVDGEVEWGPEVFGYKWSDPQEDLSFSEDDSAAKVWKSVVIDGSFYWGDDVHPETPWHETLIYETHVKGFSKLNESVPPELRGTYAGLAHPASIEHLLLLGVTAVELMPPHHFVNHQHLQDQGLSNYWGYDPIAYFAPHAAYSASGSLGGQVTEFKEMVKALHAAGIEVIIDVVYNHTGEGNQMGPTLCFRGVDNDSYYRTVAGNERYYMDFTGTGNTLNVRHPEVLKLIMDSLRYWVTEMHVDGFRFDLAATLARELYDVDRLSGFFDIIHQDPTLSQTKLIAEPWDVGEGGYQVGNFPPLWSEWNGKFRDTVREFWRGESATLADFAFRFTGSSDLYQNDGRRPRASINFVTAHDGFTLHDLVSYNDKHNDANGENNMDGENHNRSWNCGVEGETDDPAIRSLRERQKRNFITTLALAQGVPMLLGGDEMGRTQGGNNNAYCQDNEISWQDWEQRDENISLLGYVRRLKAFRERHPVFKRRRWFQGRDVYGVGVEDINWFKPSGEEMTQEDWDNGYAKTLGVFLNGQQIPDPGPRGERIVDDSFLIFFNAHHETVMCSTPPPDWGDEWEVVLATTHAHFEDEGEVVYRAKESLPVEGRSIVILMRLPGVEQPA